MRERYEGVGFDGLHDARVGKISPKRVAVAVVEEVLRLYREEYFDFNVRHFHEKLVEKHSVTVSYTWVKALLQGSGLVAKAAKEAPAEAGKKAAGGHDATHRRVEAPVVWRRAVARPDRAARRCDQRDLSRPVGRRRVNPDGNGWYS